MEKGIMDKISLNEHTKTIAIGFAIALVTLIICLGIYKKQASQIKNIKSKIEAEKEKLVLRRESAKIDKVRSGYTKFFYKTADKFILRDAISELAKDSKVDILSLQPSDIRKMGKVTQTPFKISLRCYYNRLGKFVEKIETSSQLTKVESITIKSLEQYKRKGEEGFSPANTTEAQVELVVVAYSVEQ
jgi:Tfp pilus assembly protein PilO